MSEEQQIHMPENEHQNALSKKDEAVTYVDCITRMVGNHPALLQRKVAEKHPCLDKKILEIHINFFIDELIQALPDILLLKNNTSLTNMVLFYDWKALKDLLCLQLPQFALELAVVLYCMTSKKDVLTHIEAYIEAGVKLSEKALNDIKAPLPINQLVDENQLASKNTLSNVFREHEPTTSLAYSENVLALIVSESKYDLLKAVCQNSKFKVESLLLRGVKPEARIITIAERIPGLDDDILKALKQTPSMRLAIKKSVASLMQPPLSQKLALVAGSPTHFNGSVAQVETQAYFRNHRSPAAPSQHVNTKEILLEMQADENRQVPQASSSKSTTDTKKDIKERFQQRHQQLSDTLIALKGTNNNDAKIQFIREWREFMWFVKQYAVHDTRYEIIENKLGRVFRTWLSSSYFNKEQVKAAYTSPIYIPIGFDSHIDTEKNVHVYLDKCDSYYKTPTNVQQATVPRRTF